MSGLPIQWAPTRAAATRSQMYSARWPMGSAKVSGPCRVEGTIVLWAKYLLRRGLKGRPRRPCKGFRSSSNRFLHICVLTMIHLIDNSSENHQKKAGVPSGQPLQARPCERESTLMRSLSNVQPKEATAAFATCAVRALVHAFRQCPDHLFPAVLSPSTKSGHEGMKIQAACFLACN